MKTLSFFRLVVAVGLCLAVGAVGSVATTPKIPTWYAGLAKPAFTPPNVAFPVVWTTLYVLMAVALWRLWDRHPPSSVRALSFGLEAPGAGLVVIVALWLAILATIAASARLDRTAALLLAPYLAWVTYAAALNAAIYAMNPPA